MSSFTFGWAFWYACAAGTRVESTHTTSGPEVCAACVKPSFAPAPETEPLDEELPFPHFSSYCASKGGIKMLTRNLAIELAPSKITINSIAPGAIETPINTKLLNDPVKLKELLENIPLGRLGKPEDVAGMTSFLASEESDYITGSTFFVDGGLLWNYQEQ